MHIMFLIDDFLNFYLYFPDNDAKTFSEFNVLKL